MATVYPVKDMLSMVLMTVIGGWLSPISQAFDQTAIEQLIRENRLSAARTELLKELKADENEADLWNLLGVVDAQQGDAAGARDAFERAVRLAPRLESAWLNLGRLYMMSAGDKDALDRALAAYQTALRLNPASPEAHHQLGLLLQWKGRFRESLEQLDALGEPDGSRRTAVALRCADEAALGNTGRATEAAEMLLRDPGLEEPDVVAILPAIESRNDQVVIRLIEGLAARRLATNATLPRLAAAYERKGNFEESRRVYESAFRNSPVSASLLLDLARISWKQKDYPGTLGYLAHARELEPKNPAIHFLFGLASNEMGIPVEARKSLEKALEFAPDNPYYNYAMGAVLLEWSEKAQAIPYLKKFLALKPGDARGRLALATAYFSVLDNEHARAELKPLVEIPQTRAGAEYLLGRIAAQEDDWNTAAGHFRKLVEIEPNAPEGHAELGAALLELHDAESARRESDAALSIDNDNYVANRTILRMYQLSGDARAKDQTERLRKLVAKKEQSARLLERTIEVRPW